MKRTMILMASLLWVGCSEKIPPAGPQQTGKPDVPPPESVQIDDPAPGGGGAVSPSWDYVWVPGSTLFSNYGIGGAPVTDCQAFAAQNFEWRNPSGPPMGAARHLIPHLWDQDSAADMMCLAKAIVYFCDAQAPTRTYFGDVVTYYDEAWHAIRNMMFDHVSGSYSSGTWGTECDSGWIGMARNLMGYLVAADYLLALGQPGTAGYRSSPGQAYYDADGVPPWDGGIPPLSNAQTYDSLKTFTLRIISQTNAAYKAPATTNCAKSMWLRTDMADEQPDNKGAAALASLATCAILGMNMATNPSIWGGGAWPQSDGSVSYTSVYNDAIRFFKGWGGDRSGSGWAFPTSNFDHSDGCCPGRDVWADTWVQSDSLAPVPILGPGAERKWPASATGYTCAYWGPNPPPGGTAHVMFGTLTEDLARGPTIANSPPCPGTSPNCEYQNFPSKVCGGVCQPVQNLLYDVHVAGSVNYLNDAAEVLWQEDSSWGPYTFGGTGGVGRIPQTAIWFDHWADAGPNDNWVRLSADVPNEVGEDDWPVTYILDKRGFVVQEAKPPTFAQGKQMSFTDLTHR